MCKIFYVTFVCLVSLGGAVRCLGQSRLAIPSYQDPGSPEWNDWKAVTSSSVGIMIVNLNNGDDTSYQPVIDSAIREARKRGIFVVGYVYTGYGQRDPGIVRDKIRAVFENYLVDGIFFDEVPTACNAPNVHAGTNYRYYQSLANAVRSTQSGARIVILNPGTQPRDDCWMSIANILVTAESSSVQDYAQNYQQQAWFHRYAPDRFWHIVYNVPSAPGLQEVISLGLQRGASWLYITDQGGNGGNPYGQPPAYWKLETAAFDDQAVQAPKASARPQSQDENGNPVSARASFRWIAVDGVEWHIFLASDRSGVKRYSGNKVGLAIDADYLLRAWEDGRAKLYRYERVGDDDAWVEVSANCNLYFLGGGVNLLDLDIAPFGNSHLLQYQIRSHSPTRATLFTTSVYSLSLDSTAFEFDIENHVDR